MFARLAARECKLLEGRGCLPARPECVLLPLAVVERGDGKGEVDPQEVEGVPASGF